MKAFICYSSKDSRFVIEVCSYLKQNLDEIFYFEDYQRQVENKRTGIVSQISEKIIEFDVFIAFIGNTFTQWQDLEISALIEFQCDEKNADKTKKVIPVLLGVDQLPNTLSLLSKYERIRIDNPNIQDSVAYELAHRIVSSLGLSWRSWDGLPPNSDFFQYEKNIINDYINLNKYGSSLFEGNEENQNDEDKTKAELREKLIYGLPPVWPKFKKMPDTGDDYHGNTVSEKILGKYRPVDAMVVAAALKSFHPDTETCLYRNQLTFPEAGPREFLYYPRPGRNLKVGIIVTGGIAPGINSVIDGITKRHELYASESNPIYNVEIFGFRNGFYAFDDYFRNRIILNSDYTSSIASESGSCIGTSRDVRLLDFTTDRNQCHTIITQLLNDDIEILYIIGGDGSMKAAHALWNLSKEMVKETEFKNKRISVIGIPKTMDNDILWIWQTFGFLSAVEKAREIIEQLSIEVISNPRICIIQLFGSDSGFVVSHAVVSSKSTVCDAALIPEVKFTMRQLADHIKNKIEANRGRGKIPLSLIVMAETAIPLDALDHIDNVDIGLTDNEKDAIKSFINAKQRISVNKQNDFLRSAGLKIVSKVLKELLTINDNRHISWSRLRVFTNEPRHVLRSIPPSCSDTIMGNRLGTLAVDNALAGYQDVMISQWLTEYVLVPLKLVVLGKKRIPTSGIFWKTVTAKIKQPDLNDNEDA